MIYRALAALEEKPLTAHAWIKSTRRADDGWCARTLHRSKMYSAITSLLDQELVFRHETLRLEASFNATYTLTNAGRAELARLRAVYARECAAFFDAYKDVPIGRGTTPDEAGEDLLKQCEAIAEKAKSGWKGP